MGPSEKKQMPFLPDIPDVDDDLEDLDDVLDQFNVNAAETPKRLVSPPPPPPTAAARTTFGRPRTNTRVDAPPKPAPGGFGAGSDTTAETDEEKLSAEFTQALEKGMESLMRDIMSGENGGELADESGATDEQKAEALKAAWEALLVEGMDDAMKGNEGSSGGDVDAKGGDDSNGNVAGNDFQSKIQQAMNKLRESESNLKADSKPKSDAGSGDDFLDNLISSLSGASGTETDEELAGLLEGMMGQLMSKDILYEPMKELANGLPGYLEKPPSPLSEDDRKRYQSQLECLRKILVEFEKPSYSDENEQTKKQIADLMSEMQTYGTPPAELMGPMPDGLPDSSCVVS